MDLRSHNVSPLAVAGIGSAIIAILIGAALHPPTGTPDGSFAAPEGSFVVVNDPVTLACPDVVSRLRIVPAEAHPLVTAEVAYLRRDIADANIRLTQDPGQAVDQLNDIVAERESAIERIIREVVKAGGSEPAGLRDLASCSVRRASGGAGEATSTVGAEESTDDDSAGKATPSAPDEAADAKTAAPTPGSSPSGGAKEDDAGKSDPEPTKEPGGNEGGSPSGDEPGDGSGDDGNRTPTVSCPSVASRLGDVPRSAEGEVDRNLAELRQQIAEANGRLADLAANPVGDPNFAQNTIVGPLRDRRIATLDRITIAISRVTTPPSNLAALAPCSLKG